MSLLGLEPATFRIVAYYLNHLSYRVPHIVKNLVKQIVQHGLMEHVLYTFERVMKDIA
jgi:hypothetical protein